MSAHRPSARLTALVAVSLAGVLVLGAVGARAWGRALGSDTAGGGFCKEAVSAQDWQRMQSGETVFGLDRLEVRGGRSVRVTRVRLVGGNDRLVLTHATFVPGGAVGVAASWSEAGTTGSTYPALWALREDVPGASLHPLHAGPAQLRHEPQSDDWLLVVGVRPGGDLAWASGVQVTYRSGLRARTYTGRLFLGLARTSHGCDQIQRQGSGSADQAAGLDAGASRRHDALTGLQGAKMTAVVHEVEDASAADRPGGQPGIPRHRWRYAVLTAVVAAMVAAAAASSIVLTRPPRLAVGSFYAPGPGSRVASDGLSDTKLVVDGAVGGVVHVSVSNESSFPVTVLGLDTHPETLTDLAGIEFEPHLVDHGGDASTTDGVPQVTIRPHHEVGVLLTVRFPSCLSRRPGSDDIYESVPVRVRRLHSNRTATIPLALPLWVTASVAHPAAAGCS